MAITHTFTLDPESSDRLEEMSIRTGLKNKSALVRELINAEWVRSFAVDPTARATVPAEAAQPTPQQ